MLVMLVVILGVSRAIEDDQKCIADRLALLARWLDQGDLDGARGYLETTPYRIEEEQMAVLLQRLVGTRHGDLFYPTVSGVASSYNFYPFHLILL